MGKKKKSAKTTKRHAYGLTILKASHSRIRGLKKDHEPDIHGDKFWSSSFLIMDYLKKKGLPRDSRVMEVGCGWGLAGIYCAVNHEARVTGVDADPKVFPYLHLHAEINDVTIKTRRALFEDLKRKHLEGYDLLLGADVCFWDEMVDPLYKVIRKATRAGVGQVIVADPGRPPFDEVCKRSKKELGGKVVEWEVDNGSVKTHGWLLVVGKLPTKTGA